MRRRKAGLTARPIPAPVTSPAPPPVVDEPDEAAFDPDREPLPALKSSGFAQFGSVMGGVIAGIEQQVFGRKPPGEIQVRQAQPTRGLTGDGTEVTLDFPERGHGERDDGDRGGTDRPT